MIPHEHKPKKKKKQDFLWSSFVEITNPIADPLDSTRFCIGTSSCRMIWIKPEKSRIKSRISNEFKPCQF